VSEPRTEAGLTFFDAAAGEDVTVVMVSENGHVRPALPTELALLAALDAAREQAATEARRELLAKVEGLTTWPGVVREWPDQGRLGPPEHVVVVERAAVLRLIEESQP